MAAPPLPEAFIATKPAFLPQANADGEGIFAASTTGHRPLEVGAYMVNYTPVGTVAPWVTYDGTIRITAEGTSATASGDLYSRPSSAQSLPGSSMISPGAPPNPEDGIPIFARSNYRYYIRITNTTAFAPLGGSIVVSFELWAFDRSTNEFSQRPEGVYSALMSRIAAPISWPFPDDYLEGDVRDGTNVVARLKMGLLSSMLRKVTIEIDTVKECGAPLQNARNQKWKDILGPIGFQVKIIQSQKDLPDPNHHWEDSEMHAAMLQYRDTSDLDSEWRYYILCVSRIASTERGIMFDAFGTDSNNTPREGVGIAAKWLFPASSEAPYWGEEGGKVFDTAPDSYLRTAIHEVGHAFGLLHPSDDTPVQSMDRTFMCASNSIAMAAPASLPYPRNIVWSHSRINIKRLQHWPDVFIRPGGLAFGNAQNPRPLVTPTDMDIPAPGLKLRVDPVVGQVPLGAPVRVEFAVVRDSTDARAKFSVPQDISLKSPFVSGSVKDPFGNTRTFSPLIRTIEETPMVELTEDHPEVASSLTLIRGNQGALFPSVGLHEITGRVRWEVGSGAHMVVEGKTTVLVTGTESRSHAEAAHKILRDPDVHLVLVLGGDHLTNGIEAVKQALTDPTLAPHFAAIQAKRLAQPFMDPKTGKLRTADIEKAKEVLVCDSGKAQYVLSRAETNKLKRLKLV